MSILVTGASGFIGSSLIKALGSEVIAVSRKRPVGYQGEYYCVDLGSLDDYEFLDGVETVIHCAGVAHERGCSIEYFTDINFHATLKLARLCVEKDIKRFVFVSSIGVNGSITKKRPFSTASRPDPHNPYSESKLLAEQGLTSIANETALEVVIVRPTLVYGANAPGNFGILTRLVDKLPFLPFGLAKNRRSFIAVQNLTDLLITCAHDSRAPGNIFLASDGDAVSIKDFTNSIAKGLNKNIVQLPIPTALLKLGLSFIGKSNISEQLLGDLEVDSSDAKKILGWIPPYTMKQAMADISRENK